MSKPFIVLTAAASALTFAGVWVGTTPAPIMAAPAIVEPVRVAPPMSDAPPPRVHVVAVVPEDHTHVVRDVVRPGHGVSSGRSVSVYFAGCNEARAAGAAPIYRGDPGYRQDMDGDGDGIACEPHH